MITITNEDNMSLMARYPDNYFDLGIVDPPYGIGRSKGIGKRKKEVVYTKYEDKKWDKEAPTKEYFKELFRVSKNQIVWGANYFGMPFDKMIIWDKKIGDNDFSMAEIASHSFTSSTKICSFFSGANRNGKHTTRIHPTQKPVQLYKWILDKYAKEGDKILDTHLGSGSIAIACHDYKFELTACELDKEYFDAAMLRITQHKKQFKLF
jgi:site-specific DNA-methyltransferase (adenine-specific)